MKLQICLVVASISLFPLSAFRSEKLGYLTRDPVQEEGPAVHNDVSAQIHESEHDIMNQAEPAASSFHVIAEEKKPAEGLLSVSRDAVEPKVSWKSCWAMTFGGHFYGSWGTDVGKFSLPENWFPVLGIFAACLVVMAVATVGIYHLTVTLEIRTMSLLLMDSVLPELIFASGIPDAIVLAQIFGGGSGYAGLVVGIYPLGSFIGSSVTCACLSFKPSCRTPFAKPTFVGSAAACVFCAGAYAFFGLSLRNGAGVLWGSALPLVLRFVMGFAFGLRAQLVYESMPRLIPHAERPKWSSLSFVASNVGVGLGTPLAALVHVASSSAGAMSQIYFTGMLQVVLAIGGMCSIIALLPPFKKLTDHMTTGSSATSRVQDSISFAHSAAVIGGCLSCTVLRSVAVFVVQIGTLRLLEVRCSWTDAAAGVMGGLLCMSVVPARALWAPVQDKMSTTNWIRYLAALSTCCCAFLVMPRVTCKGLLTIAVVVYALMSTMDGLSVGIMNQHVLPQPSLLNSNLVNFAYIMATNGSGRCIAPYLAFIIVDRGSALGVGDIAPFGLFLSIVNAAYLLIFERVVCRNVTATAHDLEIDDKLEKLSY
eukprot:CAMPEP_0194526122 /NCGR_PEP_ID=MMETSP0253-20130528/61858_1 /TAXON_ID=2966 /ORGANISM="Noctiluca scintillans" /LENGTH=593 /DNA_ID=CAMNT_0039370921 /DNA_START=4 /DNA_END=1785 /DNA_ORIENTATION=+